MAGVLPAVAALAVCLAYFAGSHVGLALRFPPATTSLLWPPNTVLTVALLLTASTRRWPLYLAAALPAHLVMVLPTGWPWPLVLALFATNCSEALIAAGTVRALTGGPIRFDSLRRTGLFIGAVVLLAPFVSSFADAGAVAYWRGEPFWLVWRNRLVANTLTELLLVPAGVVLLRDAVPMARRASKSRVLEAAAMVALTVVLGMVLLGAAGQRRLDGGPAVSANSLALFLVPVLWAAIRFGPAATGALLLTLTGGLLWAETHGRSFLAVPPQDAALAFQTVLGVVAVPLMCLAALMQENRKADLIIRGRLDFENLLSRLSSAFVPLASPEMEAVFERWAAHIGESLGVDRFAILLNREGRVDVAYSWAAPGLPPLGPAPLEADGSGQVLTVPLAAAGQDVGAVLLMLVRPLEGELLDELRRRLGLVADVLAGALARKEAEDALRRSEALKSAILASMPTRVAVLDRRGEVVAVNEEWSRTAAASGAGPRTAAPWDLFGETETGSGSATAMTKGVAAVLGERERSFVHEFVSGSGGRERWIHMSAVPLRLAGDSGAVVSYSDVTEQRHAEMEANQSRQELAHFLRVSTVGVMATSLAHELNQPLTAILANAQAAQRLLAKGPPDVAEFREVLADMIEEDKRAGEIISQLREMLRKGVPQKAVLDVQDLVGRVARIVWSDSLIREVDLHVEIDSATPSMVGDRTQVQQVVLNLLLNALEAAAQDPSGRRRVVLGARASTAGDVEISVRDTGKGIASELAEHVFEPFFSTKPGGMGMGLSIARSIVSAHGGTIWAEDAPGGGALFRLHLPSHAPVGAEPVAGAHET